MSRPPLECWKIELIPVKFLRDSCEIPAFQRRPETTIMGLEQGSVWSLRGTTTLAPTGCNFLVQLNWQSQLPM
jgi:hypothetical protein